MSVEKNDDLTEQIDTLDMLVEKTKEDDNHTGKWCLEMVRGPMIGERIFLKEGSTSFGRGPDCNVFLDDITVSRHHCEFVLESGKVKVVTGH